MSIDAETPSHVGRRARQGSEGFSLPEVLVASGVLAAGIMAAVQLIALATTSSIAAMHTTRAAILASQQVNALRACCPGGSLPDSPPGTLHADAAGFVEYLDWRGRPLPDGPPPPAGTVYVRRWSTEPLPADPDVRLVQVIVTPHRGRVPTDGTPGRRPGEARLTALLPVEAP